MTPEEEARKRAEEEAIRQAQQGVQQQPATVLPQQPPINGSEQVTNEYSQSGSVGGNTSYGVHQQFGTQSGTSTSGLDELSPERKSELEARQRALAEANHMDYDPATGKLTPKNTFFYDVLGIDRDAVKKDREREIAANRSRQNLNALRDSLMLVNDMVSAAVGGNVWKREKDPTNKELEERNRQLKGEQLQEDKDSADKLNSQYEKTMKGLSDLADRFNQLYATRTSRNTHNSTGTNVSSGASSQWSQSAQTSRQGTKHSQDWWAMQSLARGGGSGGGKDDTKIMKVQLKDGTTVDVQMPNDQYEASGRYLSALYNALIAAGNDKIAKILTNSGIQPIPDGKAGAGSYNGKDLLSSGIVFDDPQIRAEFVKAIQNDPSISTADKQRIIADMNTYPTKESPDGPSRFKQWWGNVKKWFGNLFEDEDDGFNWQTEEETEGGL